MEKLDVDERIKRAVEEYEKLTADAEKYEEYEARRDAILEEIWRLTSARDNALIEGREKGLAEGRREGRREGKREGKREKQIEIAKKMLLKAIPINDIVEITRAYKR